MSERAVREARDRKKDAINAVRRFLDTYLEFREIGILASQFQSAHGNKDDKLVQLKSDYYGYRSQRVFFEALYAQLNKTHFAGNCGNYLDPYSFNDANDFTLIVWYLNLAQLVWNVVTEEPFSRSEKDHLRTLLAAIPDAFVLWPTDRDRDRKAKYNFDLVTTDSNINTLKGNICTVLSITRVWRLLPHVANQLDLDCLCRWATTNSFGLIGYSKENQHFEEIVKEDLRKVIDQMLRMEEKDADCRNYDYDDDSTSVQDRLLQALHQKYMSQMHTTVDAFVKVAYRKLNELADIHIISD